ncbi:MAG: hypothetical protein HKN59_03615 [Gammaproteobacteria bacterium]|nr:hypothetical protein [Gammaproteobacteria bacterium]
MAGRQVIRRAAQVLRSGGIAAYPTEAVFGLGCDPLNRVAVDRLLRLKRRSPRLGLILVAAHEAQLADYLGPIPQDLARRMRRSWPGPQTWIAPASSACPLWLTGEHDGIAVRVSAHPVVRALCAKADMAIVSTSANRSGHPPARSALGCRMRFGDKLDIVVGGRTGGAAKPTPIRDLVTDRIIRVA